MDTYTTILVPDDLLPQITAELLAFALNPDHVEVVHGTGQREIHAHPEVAEAWFQHRNAKPPVAAGEEAPAPEPEPVPDPEPGPVQVPERDPEPAPAPAPEPAPRGPVFTTGPKTTSA